MKNGNSVCAVLSGVFLLLYSVPVVLIELFFGVDHLLALGAYLLPAAAAVFLILRRTKIAAILMTLTAVMILLLEMPEIPRFLEPNGYLATFDEATGYTEYIPRQFVALPILSILAALFFAIALYLRGRPALVLAVLAAVAELVYMIMQMASMGYVTGHPTPLNVYFPFNYAMSALLAGLFLRPRKKQTLPN